MLIVLSPSKTLDDSTDVPFETFTQPVLLKEAQSLAAALRMLSARELAKRMELSDKLAALNAQRWRDFHTPFTPKNARPALLAFKGDVYAPMRTETYTKADLTFAQAHVRILSGLYGLLRPLDLMQPYRLEMGTKLATSRGKDLYAFWQEPLNRELNMALKEEGSGVLVNLASEEYFKAVRLEMLDARVLHIDFKEKQGGKLQTIGLLAKKARGMMTDWVIRDRIRAPEALKAFHIGGYIFDKKLSDTAYYCFIRGR